MDEIKAQIQYKYVKLENDAKLQYMKEVKQKQQMEIEQLKIEKESEINQKQKLIT